MHHDRPAVAVRMPRQHRARQRRLLAFVDAVHGRDQDHRTRRVVPVDDGLGAARVELAPVVVVAGVAEVEEERLRPVAVLDVALVAACAGRFDGREQPLGGVLGAQPQALGVGDVLRRRDAEIRVDRRRIPDFRRGLLRRRAGRQRGAKIVGPESECRVQRALVERDPVLVDPPLVGRGQAVTRALRPGS